MADAPDSGLPRRSGSFRAVVRIGTTTTEYLRAGAGRPVLLLRPPTGDTATWEAIVATISGSLRVIMPDTLPDEEQLGDWFCGLLEGLGLDDVAIVADGSYGRVAIALAAGEPERVSRCVLLATAANAAGDGVIHQPLLLLPAGRPIEENVAAVVRFLVGDPSPIG